MQNYEGWAMFMDCDMLCREDINNLWNQRSDEYALMCVKHEHTPKKRLNFSARYKANILRKIGVH